MRRVGTRRRRPDYSSRAGHSPGWDATSVPAAGLPPPASGQHCGVAPSLRTTSSSPPDAGDPSAGHEGPPIAATAGGGSSAQPVWATDSSPRVVGSMSAAWPRWQAAGAPAQICAVLRSGLPWQVSRTPPVPRQDAYVRSQHARVWMDAEISRLREVGALVAAPTRATSALFVVPKDRDSFRMVVDMRGVNRCLEPEPPAFKYAGLPPVARMLEPGDWMVTLDLKSGYHQLRVSGELAQFLGIRWRGETLRFAVLPFGLSAASRPRRRSPRRRRAMPSRWTGPVFVRGRRPPSAWCRGWSPTSSGSCGRAPRSTWFGSCPSGRTAGGGRPSRRRLGGWCRWARPWRWWSRWRTRSWRAAPGGVWRR